MINFVNPKNEHDMLVQIFNQQRSHMEVYAEIEDENGLLQTPDIPVDLQSRFGQARLKDFAWRITEEMGEALDEVEKGGTLDAYYEEISDVLHFLTEYTILAGYQPKDLITITPDGNNDYLITLYVQAENNIPYVDISLEYNNLAYYTGVFVQKLAMANNLLKNKPWKRTIRETNPDTFRLKLIEVWESFITVCRAIEISPEKLHSLYFRKSDINKNRQQTGY